MPHLSFSTKYEKEASSHLLTLDKVTANGSDGFCYKPVNLLGDKSIQNQSLSACYSMQWQLDTNDPMDSSRFFLFSFESLKATHLVLSVGSSESLNICYLTFKEAACFLEVKDIVKKPKVCRTSMNTVPFIKAFFMDNFLC